MSEMGTYIKTRRGDRAVTIGRTAMVGAVVGMIAGMAMAMIEMLAGWLSAGHSAWDAPMAITSWVFGTQYFGQPSDHVGAIIVGLTLHMMNSAILGIAFLTIATRYLRRPTLLQAILAGLAFGAVAYIIVLQGLTQVRGGGEQLLLTGTAVSSQRVWIIAHLAFGMVLGLGFIAMRDRAEPANGTARRPGRPGPETV
jgi:hypothetical protein